MVYVYDASYISALIIPDEKSLKLDKSHRAISETDEIFTTQSLWYEIANIFRNLYRRKRYTFEEISRFFLLLPFVNFKTDFETGANYSKKIWNAGNDYNLSSYDAAYLELADRKNAILCTLDEKLKNAAKKLGVKVMI